MIYCHHSDNIFQTMVGNPLQWFTTLQTGHRRPGFALSGAVESVGIWNLRQGVQESRVECSGIRGLWRNPQKNMRKR